jgi:hypothetical protein
MENKLKINNKGTIKKFPKFAKKRKSDYTQHICFTSYHHIMENQQSEFFNTLLPQQPIPPSQTISSEPITSISQQQDILQSQPILQQQPIPQQSVTASSQIEQQPKQYRKLFFWNKLTSSIFWVFALICIW